MASKLYNGPASGPYTRFRNIYRAVNEILHCRDAKDIESIKKKNFNSPCRVRPQTPLCHPDYYTKFYIKNLAYFILYHATFTNIKIAMLRVTYKDVTCYH